MGTKIKKLIKKIQLKRTTVVILVFIAMAFILIRQIFELQEEKRKLYEALVSGGIPLPEYKEQKEQISERLLEVQNTKAVVMTRLEAEQEERQNQRQQMDISRMLTESDGLTSELVDLLIDKIYVYPDKRVDVAFKIRDSLATHE